MFDLREVKQVLRANLLADADVVEIAAERVFGAHGRDTEDATRSQPALIMEFVGGTSPGAASPVHGRAMHLYGYSNTSADVAIDLYQRAAKVLRRRGLSHPKAATDPECPQACVYGIEVATPVEGYNDTVGAWFARGTWRILAWGPTT